MKSSRSGPRADTPADATLVTRSRAVQPVSVRPVLDAFDAPRTVWAAPGEPTVVGCGAAATIVADEDRFETVRRAAADLFASFDGGGADAAARPRLFGGFAFHDHHETEPPWDDFPPGYFFLPSVQVVRDGEDCWLTVTAVGPDDPAAVEDRLDAVAESLRDLPDPGPVADPPGVAERRPTTGRTEWHTQVDAALDRIEAGDLTKVVLAQALGARLAADLSVPDALARLRTRYPDCHRFMLDGIGDGSDGGTGDGRATLFGATPERLASLTGRRLETEALAGSTGRGDTPEEDEWLATELLESEKDVREHEIVTGAVRDQIAPFAASVRTGARTVRKLDTVQHLQTPVTAELADATHVLDVVEALHPTPAVGGLPPDLALRTIRETESFDRGWYAAPVGWFDATGDGTFAVAIRSAVGGGTEATLFAGAGIVADSDPDREWDEIQLKYRPMLDALER